MMIVAEKYQFLYYNYFMKRIAIIGSGNGSNFEAIAKFLKTRDDIEITCLSDVEDAFILTRAENMGIKHQVLPFEQNLEYFSKNKFDLIVLAGYMKILPAEVLKEMGKVINIHPSILPAFKCSTNAIKDAFFAGVKMSGVTIHWVTSDVDGGKIIAQYPVFINNDTHFDEFEKDIHTIEHKLYPVVIEKIIDDKVFDFSDFMKPKSQKNSKGCGSKGCGGCNKG